MTYLEWIERQTELREEILLCKENLKRLEKEYDDLYLEKEDTRMPRLYRYEKGKWILFSPYSPPAS